MTGFNMFQEFVDLVQYIFSSVFISKYSFLFLALFVSSAVSIILFIMGWFNRA